LTALSLIILVERAISWELWLAFLPEKPWWVLVGFDGWTSAGAKAYHFSGLFNR
jgi:hypothetical protein